MVSALQVPHGADGNPSIHGDLSINNEAGNQIFRGCGNTKEYPVKESAADAKPLQIEVGTNQIQRYTIAHDLLRSSRNWQRRQSSFLTETKSAQLSGRE